MFFDWLQHTTPGLLTLAIVSVALLLLLIIKVKLEPFIALIVVGLAVALVGGVSIADLVGTPIKASDSLLEKGFGGILGHIAPIIGLGTVLGAIMERSGGADVLATRLLKLFGPKGAPLAMGLTGLIFGIPVFFDIGIFVLAPLVYVAAKRGGRSLVLYAMPMLAGLSMTHAFLPPHPGPVAAAGLLHGTDTAGSVTSAVLGQAVEWRPLCGDLAQQLRRRTATALCEVGLRVRRAASKDRPGPTAPAGRALR